MHDFASKLKAVVEASRPLIWLLSITSAYCGMFMAVKRVPPLHLLIVVAIGVGPCITVATNLLNAVYDIDVDRLSKPKRPLPTGRMSAASTLKIALLLYLLGLIIAFSLGFWPFLITLIGVIISALYSIPRTKIKAKGGFSNFSLALGYTAICILGGWAIFREIQEMPWLILVFLTIQDAGANVVKDFVDYEADKKFRFDTLPVKLGVEKSIMLISPFFVGIYLLIPLFYFLGYLGSIYLPISLFFAWGIYIIGSLFHDFSRKNREKIFLQAFFMSVLTEIAFTIAYVLA
jgi:4-hydroxybenzoate polyprenyltransferase